MRKLIGWILCLALATPINAQVITGRHRKVFAGGGGGGAGTITIPNTGGQHANNGNSSTSASVTFPNATAVGDVLIATCLSNAASGCTISSANEGSGWTAYSGNPITPVAGSSAAVYWVTATGTTTDSTAASCPGATSCYVAIMALHGSSGTPTIDSGATSFGMYTASGASGTSTYTGVGPITPSTTNAAYVTFVFTGDGTSTISPGSMLEHITGSNYQDVFGYYNPGNGSAVTFSGNKFGSSFGWSALTLVWH